MKQKIIAAIVFVLFGAVIGLFLTGNEHLFRAIQLTWLKGHSTANINDGKDFDTHVIAASETHEWTWTQHEDYNSKPLEKDLKDFLVRTGSAAFLIIKDGQLHTEFYFEPYHARSKTNSFSMAKTMMVMLIGAAIDDGIIESFDDEVWKYIPELKARAPDVTLAHHAAMKSGIDWSEDYYTPFSPTPKLLYGYDVERFVLDRDYPVEAGKEYYYASVSTQILGIALKRALVQKGIESSISEYFSEKFWKPMGMNDHGTWHTDSKGMELTYCCVSTNARNFARFGLLLSQKGVWYDPQGDAQQLLSEDFVELMLSPDLKPYYGHGVWTDDREAPEFSAMIGHLGQFVVMVPEHRLIVVRLGEVMDKEPDEITHFVPEEIAFYVEKAIKRVNNSAPKE